MSLTTASIGLSDGLKTAATLWEEARAGWDDPVSQAFENDYWLPLKNQVESALSALDRLAPILARAREECS
ncbi:MAG TPA: hypothetical protein VMG10_34790 [Gemmataceae bacterium]|nr:hypothetical protein [Gemmataceae bacterium]